MVNQIMDAIHNGEYAYFGIRVDDNVRYEIGDRTANSRVYDDNELTGEMLSGTSCIGIPARASIERVSKAVEMSSSYYGDNIYLIGGDSIEYGEDDGEYVIKDAVVVAILRRI